MLWWFLLVEVRGDVREQGMIREFSTEKSVYQELSAKFALRFENKGNVHLQPQGDIVIFNMWGRERGKIPINQETQFGNVLPGQTRKFAFEWKGEENLFESGRYLARATLSYGRAERQNITRETAFWVIPVKPLLIFFGGVAALLAFIVALARLYIRRILREEALRRGIAMEEKKKRSPRFPRFAKIIIVAAIVVFLGIFAQKYLTEVLQKERSFEIIVPNEAEQ